MDLNTIIIILCVLLGLCIVFMVIVGVCCATRRVFWRRRGYGSMGETIPELFDQRERSKLMSEIMSLKKELLDEQAEKEKALNRLSSIASGRVRDGNPNVVDLSDQNRPGKLGEQYSELYDNEWTDAYNAIEGLKRFSSVQVIQILLQILLNCFEKCKEDSEKQLEKIRTDLAAIVHLVAKDSKTAVDDMLYRVKEERKLFAVKQTPDFQAVKQLLLKADVVDEGVLNLEPVRLFTQACARLCWLMVVQDPPMTLLIKPRGNATECFRAYLNRGKNMLFVVWPTLLLHDGGSFVFKGIAEFGNS